MGQVCSCFLPAPAPTPSSNYSTLGTSAGKQQTSGCFAPLSDEEEILNSVVACSHDVTVAAGDDKVVRVFDWREGRVTREWRGHDRSVNRLAYGRVSGLVFSGSRDTSIGVWGDEAAGPLGESGWGNDLAGGGLKRKMEGHELTVNGLAVGGANDSRLFSGARDWTVRLWDVETGQETARNNIHQNVVSFACWVPTSEHEVVQASEDLRLRVWDTRDMSKPAQVFEAAHNNIMTCCDVAADGRTLVSSSNGFDGAGCEVKVWDRRRQAMVAELVGHTESVTCVAFMQPSPYVIISGSQDSTLRVWDVRGCTQPEGKGPDQIPSDTVMDSSRSMLAPKHRLTSLSANGGGVVHTASMSGALGKWHVKADALSISLKYSAASDPLVAT